MDVLPHAGGEELFLMCHVQSCIRQSCSHAIMQWGCLGVPHMQHSVVGLMRAHIHPRTCKHKCLNTHMPITRAHPSTCTGGICGLLPLLFDTQGQA